MTYDILYRAWAVRDDRVRASRDRSPQQRRSPLPWFIVPFCFAVAISAWLTSWPLRLRFALSHAELTRLVAEVQEAGPDWPKLNPARRRAGWYLVRVSCRYGRDGVYLETGRLLGESVGFDLCCSVEGCKHGQYKIGARWAVDDQ